MSDTFASIRSRKEDQPREPPFPSSDEFHPHAVGLQTVEPHAVREKREPFSFPGGPSFVWEAADANLVADVMVWAAQSPQAANEAFNINSHSFDRDVQDRKRSKRTAADEAVSRLLTF